MLGNLHVRFGVGVGVRFPGLHHIWIGGKLPRCLLNEFPISDLRLDWDQTPFDWTTEAGILDARDENGLLHFADCEIAGGEFTDLEGYLRAHGLPFERHSSGKYEYDPCLVEFRPDLPGTPDRYALTTQDGVPVVCNDEIEKAMRSMERLTNDKKRSAEKRLQAWERIYR